MRNLWGKWCQGRHQAQGLRDLWGAGESPARPGVLHTGTHLPKLSRPRPGDRYALWDMWRPWPHHAGAGALGQHSAGCRGWNPYSPLGRRGGWTARRPFGRSLYFSFDRGSSVLSTRWRRFALSGADFHDHGGTRWGVRGADDRWRQDSRENSGRHAIGATLPLAGQGHAGTAFEAGWRYVCAGRRRNAAEPHQAATGASRRIPKIIVE